MHINYILVKMQTVNFSSVNIVFIFKETEEEEEKKTFLLP